MNEKERLMNRRLSAIFVVSLLASVSWGCSQSETPPKPNKPPTVATGQDSPATPADNPPVPGSSEPGSSAPDPKPALPATDPPVAEPDAPPTSPEAPQDDVPVAPQVTPVHQADTPADPATPGDEPASPPRYSVSKKEPLDPIEANGKIFEGWPKPRLAIVMSGEQNGYLEPCGCAGLENQKGGLGRRFSCIKQMRDQGWPVVAVDLGNLIRRFGKQAEIKYQTSVSAYRAMGYDAIGFGPDDLRLPVDSLLNEVADETSGLASCNISLLAADSGFPARFKIVERSGLQVGITSILGEAHRADVRNESIPTMPAAEGLKQVLPDLKECDIRILLSFGTMQEARDLAKQFPEFDIIVSAGGAEMPPAEPEKLKNSKTLIVEVGHKGMYLSVLGVYDSTETPWRFQRVPVDSRFEDAGNIRLKMAAMQIQFEELGWQGLELREVSHPSGHSFVGSQKCGDCHTKAFEIWEHTPHAHATETLVKLEPHRQFDPECISCHVTGWEPQRYFPFKSGFQSLEKTPLLHGNGCENCHGPGSRHVAIEEFDIEVSDDERDKVRGEMRLTLKKDEEGKERNGDACMKCHDLDNSPEFIKQGFDAYWPAIMHKGKD